MQAPCLRPAPSLRQTVHGTNTPLCTKRRQQIPGVGGSTPLYAVHHTRCQPHHQQWQRGVQSTSAWQHTAGLSRHVPPQRRQAGFLPSWHTRQAACRALPVACVLPASGDIITIITSAPGRDVAAMVISMLGAIVWVKFFDLLARHEVLNQKLSRKLVHITTGPLFVLTWPLFSSAPEARYYAAVIPVLQGIRLALIGWGVIDSPNTVRAVSREGDRCTCCSHYLECHHCS
mmetsp:Transcript_2143/g.6389  ORF Transcript_2143/g.6389 Transcript_2143/m.6389 type:complete len:231 (+) Transcript_2143:399-1091(+)